MATYKADDIQVLEGLEPVRKRPGMYIGSTSSTGLQQLFWEILDNSVDEVLNGHANIIECILHSDGGVTIKDNGRGIPIDQFRKTKKSAMEILFTTLHSGGKFGQGKRRFGLGRVMAKLASTSAAQSSLTFLVMNLELALGRFFLSMFFTWHSLAALLKPPTGCPARPFALIRGPQPQRSPRPHRARSRDHR